jgi:lysophospholipase L1-like esterase
MMNKLLFPIIVVGLLLTFISSSAASNNDDILDEQEEQVFTICDYPLYPPADTLIASHGEWIQSNFKNRINAFRQDSIYANSVVMLGNSLTEKGGNWSERFNRDRVSNRGIAGDNADGVLARLGELICAEPISIFIMIGTNDLWTNYSVELVAAKIENIGNLLAESLPKSNIYIQTIMPIEEGHNRTFRLKQINNLLRSVENPLYTLIDTFSEMAVDDALPANYTTDGVHLTEEGYNKWVSILMPFIQ